MFSALLLLGCKNTTNDNSDIGLGVLIVFLIICFVITKKDCKESNDSYGIQKVFIIKAIIGINLLILIIIYKIIKDKG